MSSHINTIHIAEVKTQGFGSGFDLMTSGSVHVEVLPWTICPPTLVLIAQAVFLHVLFVMFLWCSVEFVMSRRLTFKIVQSEVQYGLHLPRQLTYSFLLSSLPMLAV